MKKIFLFLFIGTLLIPQVFALTAQIDVLPEFHTGEILSFDYRIISYENEKIVYTPSIYCPAIAMPPLEIKEIDLLANQAIEDKFTGTVVDSEFEPQICTASIQLFSPVEKTISENFSIITKPSLPFDINICKNPACTKKAKVFVLNKDIYLDYTSEVTEPTITAVLTYPDKTTKQITIPTSLKATQIGAYELEITASKQGYKTLTKIEQFAVIEKEPDIKYKEEIEKAMPIPWWLYLIIACIIAAIIIILYEKKIFKK